MEVVDADDLVSPCFLKRKHDVRACHVVVVGQSTLAREKGILTDVTGAAGDEDTLTKKKVELTYDGGRRSRTLRECFSVEGM